MEDLDRKISSLKMKDDPFRQRAQQQFNFEFSIVTVDATCSNLVAKLGSNVTHEELLSNVDQFLVRDMLQSKFYNFEFMRALSCLMRLGLTIDRNLTASRFLTKFFTDMEQIGGVSLEGTAMKSGQEGLGDMFVIKIPQRGMEAQMIHELFVGVGGPLRDSAGNVGFFIGVNWLRNVCLNYAQIFGAFRCSPPSIDRLSKKVVGGCDTSNPGTFTTYVIYERINGPTASDYAKQMTMDDLIGSCIQVALALELGNLYNGFTHYDLHTENVIMRDMGEIVQVPFMISNNMRFYVLSRYIPTFIDYGRAHIQFPPSTNEAFHVGFNASYGPEFGIYPDVSRPFHDLYKFICFTLMDLRIAQNPIYHRALQLMEFFGVTADNAEILLVNQFHENRFSLAGPLETNFCTQSRTNPGFCARESDLTMFDFMAFIEISFNEIYLKTMFREPKPGIRLLECGTDCNSFTTEIVNMTSRTENVNDLKIGSFSTTADIMKYRNNIALRANYFQLNHKDSEYADLLNSDVDQFDARIRESFPKMKEQLFSDLVAEGKSVKEAFQAIGYPFQYRNEPSSKTDENAAEVYAIEQYVNRMALFAKEYAEFDEDYEAYKTLSKIARKPIDPWVEEFVSKQIAPMYNAYRISRGEMVTFLEILNPLPPDVVTVRNLLIQRLRT